MSYHRSPFVRRTRRNPSALDGVLDPILNFLGQRTTPQPAPQAPSATWSPTTDDQKAKTAAGCTPLEIVASPGTSPYVSCQSKVAAKAGGGSGGGIASEVAKLLGGLVGNAVNPTPQMPVYATAASSGLTTGQMVAGGAAALALIYIATKD